MINTHTAIYNAMSRYIGLQSNRSGGN